MGTLSARRKLASEAGEQTGEAGLRDPDGDDVRMREARPGIVFEAHHLDDAVAAAGGEQGFEGEAQVELSQCRRRPVEAGLAPAELDPRIGPEARGDVAERRTGALPGEGLARDHETRMPAVADEFDVL